MNRWAALAPLAVLLLVVVVGALLLMRPGQHQTITTGQMDRTAPAYSLPRLGRGAAVTKAGHRQPYLINVFASWCTPCRAEHDQLLALQSSGIEIVGVAYKDAPDDTQRFLQELGDPYSAVGVDRAGAFALDLGITGVPETYVISSDGRIRAVYRGPLTADVIQREILPALRAAR